MTLESLSYSIIQFVPHPVRDERVNLGVVVVSDARRQSDCCFLTGYDQKVKMLEPDANIQGLQQLLDSLKSSFVRSEQRNGHGEADGHVTSTAQLQALSKTMSGQLRLTPPRPYRAESLETAIEVLYAELVAPLRRMASSR